MSQEEIRQRTTNPLSVFASDPVGVSFENQEKGEKIILLLRQHLATQIMVVLEIVFLFLLPIIVSPVVMVFRVDVFSYLGTNQVFWVVLCWYFFVLGFTFYKFIHWYFNVYILTNERIIDFDFKGVLNSETAYANLNQIQDVSPKIVGFSGTFFHYGDVYIQTASEVPEFDFESVKFPDEVAQRILAEVRIEEAEKPGEVA
jgi:uncharacterized membrane protein YdbT with pleckstrin-like domain